MDREKTSRKRFADKKWDGLTPMIDAYAAEAQDIARHDFREPLDYSGAAPPVLIERLDRILNRLCPSPEPLNPADGEWMTLLWGSYFGELLRHIHGGEWTMTLYPGSDFAVPTLEIDGSRLYPLMKVHRRLSMGATESLPAFYSMLTARLRPPVPAPDPTGFTPPKL
jgi:hypothetical protein